MEKHSVFSDIFIGIGCFKGTLSLKVKDNAKSYQVPYKTHGTCASGTLQKELQRHKNNNYTIKDRRQNGRMIQQIHGGTQTKWNSLTQPRPSKAEPGINMGGI